MRLYSPLLLSLINLLIMVPTWVILVCLHPTAVWMCVFGLLFNGFIGGVNLWYWILVRSDAQPDPVVTLKS